MQLERTEKSKLINLIRDYNFSYLRRPGFRLEDTANELNTFLKDLIQKYHLDIPVSLPKEEVQPLTEEDTDQLHPGNIIYFVTKDSTYLPKLILYYGYNGSRKGYVITDAVQWLADAQTKDIWQSGNFYPTGTIYARTDEITSTSIDDFQDNSWATEGEA